MTNHERCDRVDHRESKKLLLLIKLDTFHIIITITQ